MMERVSALRRSEPQQLIEFRDFLYHKGSILGKGSYGKVYAGWMKSNYEEVAVKVVKAEFYENDAKVRENLYREIDIQDDLKECRNVVRLISRVEKSEGLFLVMEKCDYDLQHHLNAVKALNEPATKDFLFQLGNGIEYMHKRGIVHRDLKPANVLLVRDGVGGVVVKLADFGFARHFRKGEGTKPLDMTSLAGTPVFMAPEALECVFYKGKHYDEKVDMWSVGAVLYQCLVGRPAFYAQLQDILPILKKKGDAIAFKRGRSGQIQYIKELPSDVDTRLTKRFKMQMNTLLRQLLQVSASKRLSYDEFFSFVDQLNRTPLDVYCPSNGAKYTVSAAVDTPCREIGKMIADASAILVEDQIVFEVDSGTIIDVESDLGLPQTVQATTEQWTFVVLSKKQLSDENPPAADEEYVQSLLNILDDPGRAIGVVQAQGLSVMCAEVVGSANAMRQIVTTALSSYRRIAERSQQLLYDVRTDLRLERARYENASKMVLEIVQDDLDNAVETRSLSEEQIAPLKAYVATIRDSHTNTVSLLSKCEDDCTASYDSMTVEEDIQSLSSVQGDLSPLLEECRRITHFQGQLLLSSTKALVAQCRQKQTLFLHGVHDKLRSLFTYSHYVPKFETRIAAIKNKCKASHEELKAQRNLFRSALFEALSNKEGEFPSMQSIHVALAASSISSGDHQVRESDISGDEEESLKALKEKNEHLARDKKQLLRQVDELELKLQGYQNSGASGSIWEMIGSADIQTQVTGTFPTNAMHMDTGLEGNHSCQTIREEQTFTPAMAENLGTLAPAEPVRSASPSTTLAAPAPAPRLNPRDELDLESIRLSLTKLLGLTQKLQEIVCYQPSGGNDESEFNVGLSDVLGDSASSEGGSIMDTWRAATDISGMSMLSERKLVDSLKTIVDLSQFIDIDGLKSAVRAIATQISYKNFAVGQVILFLVTGKEGVYTAFHDTRGARYFLRSDLVASDKPAWMLGRLKSLPKLEKSQTTRNPYCQPKYTTFYVMEATVFASGSEL